MVVDTIKKYYPHLYDFYDNENGRFVKVKAIDHAYRYVWRGEALLLLGARRWFSCTVGLCRSSSVVLCGFFFCVLYAVVSMLRVVWHAF